MHVKQTSLTLIQYFLTPGNLDLLIVEDTDLRDGVHSHTDDWCPGHRLNP